MQQSTETAEPTASGEPGSTADEIERHGTRNLLVLALHHVCLRVAWIFKTESVVMPAFLDTVVGTPGLRDFTRGCLPVLNRFGQSVPPLIFAERITHAPLKSRVLRGTTLAMAGCFLTLSALWFLLPDKQVVWFPIVFLVLYTIFFSATGLTHIAFGTLQGKLVAVQRRGRLMALAGITGSVCAITAAWFLLQRWLAVADSGEAIGGFGYVFGFTGVGFVVASCCLLGVHEPRDAYEPVRSRLRDHFHRAWQALRSDPAFRRVCLVAMLFMTIQLLFPHYQALGRSTLSGARDDPAFHLMLWVVVQNAGAGLFSLVAGGVADRFGNRLAVRITILISALVPLLAVLFTRQWFAAGPVFFPVTFFLLGLTPVAMRTFSNYVLEFGESADHARYLSTLRLCMAGPFLLSPLVGLLVGLLGFVPIFVAIAVLVATAGGLTFTLHEPRHAAEE